MIDTLLANRYRIQAKVGEGGMAVVYKAMDVVLRRIVAIKVLRAQYAGDQEFVDRFRREAQAAASLSHPNVVNIFDVGQDGDVHYIVLEYVQGQNLKEIVRAEGRVAPRQAAQLARSVARALDAAHACGLVHRDIKPHNILLTLDGRVKVTDFGLARAASAATLTETGVVIGSVHYFSPEQARGQPVGPASDIYSLGVVLYEMLTGTVPFRGDSPIAVALKHLQQEPVPPREHNRHIPAWLEQVVLRALAKAPAERYHSAAAMVEALAWRDEPRVPAPAAVATSGGDGEPRGLGAAQHAARANDDALDAPDLHGELRRALRGERHADSTSADEYAGGDHAAAAQDDSSQRRGSRARKWLTVLVIIVLLAGAVYVGTPYMLALVFPPEVSVPDVVGLTYDEARPLMDEAGLVLEIEAEHFHPEIASGLIVRQNPGAERIVRQGRHVRIVLSRGPEIGHVPDVRELALREARIALTQAGYTLGEEFDELDDDLPVNHVIAQQPAPGVEVERGTPVDLWVNRPAAISNDMVTVPDFRGRDLEQAIAELETLGLLVGNRWPELRPLVPGGHVLDQNPEPDTLVEPGTAVDFVYSEGVSDTMAEEPADAPQAAELGGAELDEGDSDVDWETVLLDEVDSRRRRARVDIEVPAGRAQEVVILIIDDFGAREVYRETVTGGTTLHEFVEGRGEDARLQVYVGGVMYMDETFPD